jgi:hypothetical protein
VFTGCDALQTVYYHGEKSAWDALNKGKNSCLTGANVYYYSEERRVGETDTFWHFVDGNPILWV